MELGRQCGLHFHSRFAGIGQQLFKILVVHVRYNNIKALLYFRTYQARLLPTHQSPAFQK